MAERYFETERYRAFVERHLAHVDGAMVEYVESPSFDALLVETVRSTFPPAEHEHFVAHYRGLLAAWAGDQHRAAATGAAAGTPEM
jgi:hypothetical protein